LEADLTRAHLNEANLSGADLTGASLQGVQLIQTDLTDADLTGCRIHGIAAWGPKLAGAKQRDLVITRDDEAKITVNNIEVARFHNPKIRDVIDTIGRKR
jgi:uncharacterized protein YjbI with pentapeptide repeats